ncbi:MotA/TolQ/ExbB proton channel family protein [Marinobacter pelagius]|uniref:Outer membrane transport energization protein ExbB (TC 2.C.1.1.1) n=1 Tax=Marinobacter pelagius TaxID=379482 RepID=A0A1I4RYU6_9GAMM|nr:MotA/TolQ/ExbB proton channel family protein [Marinobacter pelagius]SFM57462.1 outer membrane transport energization protein ExbB (TC 2.C.1.1.1) [Marinobacter pelagius]
MSDPANVVSFPFLQGPIAQLIDMGGPVMVVLLVLAALGLVTFFYLMLSGTLYAPRLNRHLKQTLRHWQANPGAVDPEHLRSQARFRDRMNPLLHLVADTIDACKKRVDGQQIRETAARDAQHALEPFEAPLKIIEVIAALAPLLGLLGTVMGMMEAFSAMAATEGRANAAQLSGGIYEALTTTAAGLVVAIPFAALAAWIEFRLRRIHKTINSTLVSILSVADTPRSNEDELSPSGEAGAARPREQAENNGFTGRQRFAHATG